MEVRIIVLALAFAGSLAGRWLKLESGPFTVYSEGREAGARRALAQLERAQHAFRAITGRRNALPLPVRVVILSDSRFRALRPSRMARGFYQSAAQRDSIVLPAGSETSRALLHEFTHLVLHHTMGPLPQWLEEGLAEFHSTLEFERGRIRMGAFLREHARLLASVRLLSGPELAAVDKRSALYHEDEQTGTFYAQSWALVHMLRSDARYRGAFGSFLAGLDAGEPQGAAFQRAFGQSMAEAVAELPGYLARATAAVTEIRVELPEIEERLEPAAMAPLEAEFAFAELAMETGHPEEAEPIYRRAVKEAGGTPREEYLLGLYALLRNRREEALEHLARATRQENAPAEACFEHAMLLRELHGEPAEVRPLLERAVERNPRYAEAHFLLGVFEANADRHKEAIPHLEQAASIFPRQSYFWHALAVSYHALGREEESRRAARRALEAAADAEQAEMARAALRLSEDAPLAVEAKPEVTTPDSWRNPQGDQRAEGVLERIDCLGVAARFVIRAGGESLALLVENPGAVLLKNLSSMTFEFRCGPQKPAPVVVEYQRRPDSKTGTAGVVTSIEFR